MSKSLSLTLFCLTIVDVIVLYFGIMMMGFAGEGAPPGDPRPLLFWAIALIPLLAVLAPAVAWLAPWPLTTPMRRAFACALPAIYTIALMASLYTLT